MIAVVLDGAEELVALAAVELLLQEQLGVAENGGHGGADFMAHVGEEVALGPACRFGRLLGHLKLGGPLDDAVLQFIAGLLQGIPPLLDLVEHGVEAVVEHAHLVVAEVLDANRVIVVAGDTLHGFGQPRDRRGEEHLQASRQDQRNRQRNRQHRQGDSYKVPCLLPQLAHARTEINRADLVSSQSDLLGNVQAVGANEGRTACGRRRRHEKTFR